MTLIERHYQRTYYRKRQRVRQRRLLLVLVCCLMTVGLAVAWSTVSMTPKYPWLKAPENFYKPEVVSTTPSTTSIDLEPLPEAREDRALKAQIKALLNTYPNTLTPYLYYYNLQNHRYVSINGDKDVPAASVIKLPILLEYLHKVDQGRMTPYTHLLYHDFEQSGGSGGLQYKPTGQPLLARDVAAMMIQSSDNTCTNMLIYHLGGADELNRTFMAQGLDRTHIANWLPDLKGTNVISMQDMATVLYNLTEGDYLSPQSQEAALEILKGTHNRKLLPALLPRETMVAHKTGDIGTSLGNAGLIELPDGRRYIVAIQVERPFNNYDAKDMIQKVSRLIYDDLTGAATSVTPIAANTSR